MTVDGMEQQVGECECMCEQVREENLGWGYNFCLVSCAKWDKWKLSGSGEWEFIEI